MSFTIDYSLRGSGWARCTVSLDEKAIDLTASYLSDALGNLVLAACMAFSGFHSVAFGFDEEPGEFRWVINRASGNELSLHILEFAELWGNKPNSHGKVLLECVLPVEVFAKEVHRAACAVQTRHGVEGYAEEWVEHPFPTHQLAYLGQLLERYQNDA
jgi:hypothetical protein